MKKIIIIIFVIFINSFHAYDLNLFLGEKALYEKKYDKAIYFFSELSKSDNEDLVSLSIGYLLQIKIETGNISYDDFFNKFLRQFTYYGEDDDEEEDSEISYKDNEELKKKKIVKIDKLEKTKSDKTVDLNDDIFKYYYLDFSNGKNNYNLFKLDEFELLKNNFYLNTLNEFLFLDPKYLVCFDNGINFYYFPLFKNIKYHNSYIYNSFLFIMNSFDNFFIINTKIKLYKDFYFLISNLLNNEIKFFKNYKIYLNEDFDKKFNKFSIKKFNKINPLFCFDFLKDFNILLNNKFYLNLYYISYLRAFKSFKAYFGDNHFYAFLNKICSEKYDFNKPIKFIFINEEYNENKVFEKDSDFFIDKKLYKEKDFYEFTLKDESFYYVLLYMNALEQQRREYFFLKPDYFNYIQHEHFVGFFNRFISKISYEPKFGFYKSLDFYKLDFSSKLLYQALYYYNIQRSLSLSNKAFSEGFYFVPIKHFISNINSPIGDRRLLFLFFKSLNELFLDDITISILF